MRVFNALDHLDASLHGAVVSVGNFDGVHLGHQCILRTAAERASESNADVVAITFDPHPVAILRPDAAPARLTPWPEKLRLLERAGADAVVRLAADRALLSMSATGFVRDLLVARFRPTWIVEGTNFGFGKDRRGDVELLKSMAAECGFRVDVVEPCSVPGPDGAERIVSSSEIRKALSSGDVGAAAALLGRPYRVFGTIVSGAGQGRLLGFPTINLKVSDQLIPGEGVYAGTARVDGRERPAAISIGTRPTFDGCDLIVEAFILDDGDDWYGEQATLDLVRRLRDQMRFSGPEELSRQIAEDVEAVRTIIPQAVA